MLSDEIRYRLLRLLEPNPQLSQREVARSLGMSLGKANYCLRALAEKGWIKAMNFKNSKERSAYMYFLTPAGVREKSRVTARFLRFKVREYELLKAEIKQIRGEATQRVRR